MIEKDVFVAVIGMDGGRQEIEVRTDEETIVREIRRWFPEGTAAQQGTEFYLSSGIRVARYVKRRVAWLEE